MDRVWQVKEIVGAIKEILEDHFFDVVIEGEVSNLTSSGANHHYFTISDKESSLSCVMFAGDALRNPAIKKMGDGSQIVATGTISVYPKRGTFQLLVKKITLGGEGKLKAQFEVLKKQLAQKGYFDLERKKKIPIMPFRIAVVTAPQAAALADFLQVMDRRCFGHDITLFPSLMQGEKAAMSIIESLKKIDEDGHPFDVIVITRGGGSMEDLWCFNDPRLVECIYHLKTPVISAVGHQIDFTLCDYVADLRCETPTAAAEILSQYQTQMIDKLNYIQNRLIQFGEVTLREIHLKHQRYSIEGFEKILSHKMITLKNRLNRSNVFERWFEISRFYNASQRLDEASFSLKNVILERLRDRFHRVDVSGQLLHSLGPNNILKRGYLYLQDDQGNVVSRKSEFLEKEKMTANFQLHFYDGTIKIAKEGNDDN